MKNPSALLILSIFTLSGVTALAQFGPGRTASGPSLGGATGKLFEDHPVFSAALEFQNRDASGKSMLMPGKISFDAGKSRFEVNLAEVQGGGMSADVAAQLKSMGMEQMVTLTLPDRKISCLIYPGMEGYVEKKLTGDAVASPADYTSERTELGKESVAGHPCIKYLVITTGKDGVKHEATVWNATDSKKFPVKIETHESGSTNLMLFKDVLFFKPAPSDFEMPVRYTRHASMQAMMQHLMMKQMEGAVGAPPQR